MTDPRNKQTIKKVITKNQRENVIFLSPFQERCVLQRELKSEKKTQRIPISGSIGTKHRSGPRASLPPRRWSKTVRTGPTTGCRRSFNALSFRIFSFPLSSPLFFLLPSVLVSRALPLVCFSRRDDWRIDSVREAGTKGGAVWPSPSCLRGPKVMWRRRLARRRRRASFRLACRFPPIGQSMRFSPSRPTWLNLEIRVCAFMARVNIWTLRCFRDSVISNIDFQWRWKMDDACFKINDFIDL